MFNLSHNEGDTQLPRHPIVVIIDFVGVIVTLYFLTLSTHWSITLYLVTVLTMFIVSIVHHWLRDAKWHKELDHIMIYTLIGMTAIPYWGLYIPFETKSIGYLFIAFVIIFGLLARFLLRLKNKQSVYLYGTFVIILSIYFFVHYEEVGGPYNLFWVFGTFLYMIQGCIIGYKLLDFKPNKIGYREFQHLFLLLATTVHGYVAVYLNL